jgi:hypothetical protein
LNGRRKGSFKLVTRIERESNGKYRALDLRPDLKEIR